MPELTMADILAASGGGYDPYADPSGGTASMGDVLRAVGHQVAPAWVDPQQSPLSAREAATQLSAQRNKPPDPLEVMLGVAGGPSMPAAFIGPIGIRRLAAAGYPEYQQALDKALGMRAKGVAPEEIYQSTRIGEGPGISFQHDRPYAETPGIGTGFKPEADLPKIVGGKGGVEALMAGHEDYLPSIQVSPGAKGKTIADVWHDPMFLTAYPELGALPFNFKDPLPRPGYMNVGGLNYTKGMENLSLNPEAFAPETFREEARKVIAHELTHGMQGVEKAPKGGNPNVLAVEQAANSAIEQRRSELIDQLKAANAQPNKTDADIARIRQLTNDYIEAGKPEALRAEKYKQYWNLAGEAQARNVPARMDMTPAELAAKDPAVTQDVPYGEQLLRLGEWPTFPMPKPVYRQPEQLKLDLSTAPSFSERMGEARDVSFQRAQRGQATGDYGLGTARRTAPEAPPGSFEDLAARTRAGFQGDKARILDEYRAATGQQPVGRAEPLLAPGERPEDLQFSTVLRPDRPLFDLSQKGLARSHVEREQFDIPRTEAETVPPAYEKATSKANIARVNREVAAGLKEGGPNWHAMGQLRDRYIAELGEKKGSAEFENYMREVGATSPNSNVEQNFRTASYYAWLRRQGLPLPEVITSPKGNPMIAKGDIPTPYGNTAQGLHVMNLGLLREGQPYPLSRPKVPSFTENMLGNYRPVAVDRHNLSMWGIDADAPNLTGYKHLERTQQEQAGRMGIPPAVYQAAPWPYYAKSGFDPALKLFQNRVMHTAEATGRTPGQVLRDFIRGKEKLLSLTPAAVLLAQSQDQSVPAPEQ